MLLNRYPLSNSIYSKKLISVGLTYGYSMNLFKIYEILK